MIAIAWVTKFARSANFTRNSLKTTFLNPLQFGGSIRYWMSKRVEVREEIGVVAGGFITGPFYLVSMSLLLSDLRCGQGVMDPPSNR